MLGVILLVAAGLRFHGLPQLGFWTDELFSLSDANGWGLQPAHLHGTGLLPPGQPHYTWRSDARSWGAMLAELGRSEIHPPLYFLLLRGWENLFQADDEVTVRSLNVLLALAAIGLLYVALREQEHPPAVALWACAIMAVAGPQIEYAQEVRDYMPLVTFSLAAAVPLLRIERRGVSTSRLLALAGCLLAVMLSSYFGVALIGAMGIYVVWQFRARSRRWVLFTFAATGVVYAATWGPFLLRQLPRFVEGHTWLIVNGPAHAPREWMALLTLPARLLFEAGDHGPFFRLAPWSCGLWLLLPWGLLHRLTRLWALWLAVPVIVITISDLRESMIQLTMIRFTLGASPGLYALIAVAGDALAGAAGRFNWRSSLLPAGGVLLAALALPAAYTPPWKLDFRTAARAVASRLNARTDALVFVGPPNDELWTAVSFSGFRHYLPHDPPLVAILQDRADDALLKRLALCRTVWVVSRPLTDPLQRFLPGYEIQEEGEVPEFVAVLRGVVRRPTTAPAPRLESIPPR